jgi:hypothetical protein
LAWLGFVFPVAIFWRIVPHADNQVGSMLFDVFFGFMLSKLEADGFSFSLDLLPRH